MSLAAPFVKGGKHQTKASAGGLNATQVMRN